MQRIIDLELWSKPLTTIAPYDGKAVADRCRLDTEQPREVVLGLNFVPGPTDVENVRLILQNGESTKPEFEHFCQAHGLPPELNNELSSARFLIYLWGQPLAWLHLPEEAEGRKAVLAVYRWAESRGFVITKGQGENAMSMSELLLHWPHDA